VIKALAAIELDLASSRAMRFACQLGNFIEMEIHPVYVKESPPRELAIGTGWARRHWEEDLIQQGKTEISEMLASEIDFCPVLKETRVLFGNRETELVKILEKEDFDLYIEGAYFNWTASALYQKIYSKVFQRARGPLALARVLRKIYELLILCLEPAGTRALGASFQRLWAGCSVPISLALPRGAQAGLRAEVGQAETALAGAGCQVKVQEDFSYFPEPPGEEFLRQYGLLALALPRDLKKDSPQLTWLAQVKAPVLLVLY
jgi:nucleotide-binding universal stress UspA family protein